MFLAARKQDFPPVPGRAGVVADGPVSLYVCVTGFAVEPGRYCNAGALTPWQ